MGTFNDSARPRYLPLSPRRRLEVDYLLDAPTVPVALTVVDHKGREVRNDGEVIALAWRLTRGRERPRTALAALRALLGVALRRQRERVAAECAARNLAQAEEHDACSWVDQPIEYAVCDQPAEYDGVDRAPEDTGDLWESCFGNDPEARHVYLDGDDVDAFAAELDALQRQSLTGRVLRDLDRAAGGSR
jgi:hypothetical protein